MSDDRRQRQVSSATFLETPAMIKGYVRFHGIRIKDQHIGPDSMQSEVVFDYEARGAEQHRLVAPVKSPAGGDFGEDAIEVVLPEDLNLPINYAAFREAVERYYRAALTRVVPEGATDVDIKESVASGLHLAVFDVDAEPGPQVSAQDCAQPAFGPLPPDSPLMRLTVVENIDFVGQDVYLDGRKFRDCSFRDCHIHFDYGAFFLQYVQRRPEFDSCTFVPGPHAAAVLALANLVNS